MGRNAWRWSGLISMTSDGLAAEIAFGELLRAPYKALRTLKPRLRRNPSEAWIADPSLSARRSVYTCCLALQAIGMMPPIWRSEIDRALPAQDVANLSAMLAADLELRGPSRLSWLHETFFVDRHRTLPEIDAALLALSVQGEADAAVPREKVVEAYRAFIKERKPMAGFVATELANWEAWEAMPDYIEIIRSKAVKDPAGEFAILSYLKSSPLTSEARLPCSSPNEAAINQHMSCVTTLPADNERVTHAKAPIAELS